MKKNIKLVLALVLSIMMVLGSMSALAADPTGTNAGHGSITISNAMKGHTYTAYQIFAGVYDTASKKLSNIDWGADIKDAGKTALYTKYSLTGTDQTAAKVAEAIGSYDADAVEFADAIGYTNVQGGKANGAADDSGTYQISDLADGYYMVVDTYTPAEGEKDVYYSRYMVQIVDNATVSVANKADKPPVEKDIDKDNDLSTTNDRTDENTANIGDTVTYVITSHVPDMTGYKEYYMDFSDTLSKGLTYDEGSLKVSINGTELVKDTAYTLNVGTYSKTDGTKITVHLKDLVYRQYAKNAPIVITYTAKVNDDAVIGNTGNPNTVDLTYSNDPKHSGDGTPDNPDNDIVTGVTPPSEVKTFVTELELVKVDGSDTTKVLPGAVFHVKATEINKVIITGEHFVEATEGGTHWLLKDGTYTDKEPTELTKTQYADETKKYKKEAYATTSVAETKDEEFEVVTGTDGKIKLTGLKEGTYIFKEIQAPAGYNLLKTPITVTITSNIDRQDKTATFAWSANGAQETETGSGKFTFQVQNNSGNTLPETGGIGTTIFYVAGSILVLAAAILLITKRRMGSND